MLLVTIVFDSCLPDKASIVKKNTGNKHVLWPTRTHCKIVNRKFTIQIASPFRGSPHTIESSNPKPFRNLDTDEWISSVLYTHTGLHLHWYFQYFRFWYGQWVGGWRGGVLPLYVFGDVTELNILLWSYKNFFAHPTFTFITLGFLIKRIWVFATNSDFLIPIF